MSDAPRKAPRQDRSRETVDVVLEAAAQVFEREGLSATTNRIAERAGVSIGSVYQYFPNKHALLYALAERHVRDTVERLDKLFARLRTELRPFDDTMRRILGEVVALHSDRPGLHGLLHRVAPRRAKELAALQEFEDHLAREIAFHLERCDRAGDDDPLVTAQVLVHAIDAHLHRVLTRRGMDVDQLVDLVERLLTHPA
ncbi:TetR/AcrR family transcriptional regulator [Mycolicibacterium wolinskyi]|uniref:TetR family transcriptional regulator n=1 Tax=Mycolicibacterium wolinskyi TaxID=59750 RepID=A0A1X2FAQ2_9MYCO|nr:MULTISPECIES: TetR/AcrR family transcriptional regulator [Mycolicibacterium]MCV7285580.1 TetR/AcrR family transcriptional regulator [Mycolicibacterium wolinskyi]MCV7291389.1 TetR/AcrR family transcriptional regulator [Mycolicibacterium goodii]ORX15522.1 TetR family transcriptional regulator [Mycolicibacterium wolinskyi]